MTHKKKQYLLYIIKIFFKHLALLIAASSLIVYLLIDVFKITNSNIYVFFELLFIGVIGYKFYSVASKRLLRRKDLIKASEEKNKQIKDINSKIREKNKKLKSNNKKLNIAKNNAKEREQFLNHIVDTFNHFIFVKDEFGKYILANKSYTDFLGLERKDVINHDVYNLSKLPIKVQNEIVIEDQELISGKISRIKHEPSCIAIEPEEVWFERTKMCFKFDDKKYILGVAADVTEKVKLEVKMRNAINNLEVLLMEKKKSYERLQLLTNIFSEMKQSNYINLEDVMKKTFRVFFDMLEIVDYGSIYLFKSNQVKYLDAIGYSLQELNAADINLSHFKSTIRKEPLIYSEMELAQILKEDGLYSNALALKEAIWIGFYHNNKMFGGMAMEIAQGNEENFSEYHKNFISAAAKTIEILMFFSYFNEFESDIELNLIKVFSKMLIIHDEYTKDHSSEVARLGKLLASSLELPDRKIKEAYWAGIVHDIGKIEVPREILNKTSRLTDEEYKMIKKHPYTGYMALKDLEKLEDISKYVLYHHERWDGSGYPEGLESNSIPLVSQILSVVDAWDAMTSKRSYRNALSRKVAYEEIKNNIGSQFSPVVAREFLSLIDKDVI